MREHPATFIWGVVFILIGLLYLLHRLDVVGFSVWRLWPVVIIAVGLIVLLGGRLSKRD